MKGFRLLSLILILTLLGGCSGISAEELYCLPEANQDYYDLQTALSAVLSDGYTYQAPSAGARRDAVQLVDLNANGVDEAVAFFKNQEGSLTIYIFARTGEAYETADVIECAGSAVGTVEYADLDGDGTLELLAACQVSESVTQALQVFQFSQGEAVSLLTAPCGVFYLTDLNRDGAREILCLTDGGGESPAQAEYYTMEPEGLVSRREIALSAGYGSILHVQQGTLTDGAEAAVISLDGGDQIVTDVLVAGEEGLSALEGGDILSTDRIRGSMLPADVNDDGCVEIPKATMLRPNGEGTAYWAVSWYGLSSAGESRLAAMTYHDVSENWYLELPEAWWDQITIEEENGGNCRALTFCRVTETGQTGQALLTVYILKGPDRQSRAEQQDLTIVYSDADRILAVSLGLAPEEWEGAVTMAQVSALFHVDETPGAGKN